MSQSIPFLATLATEADAAALREEVQRKAHAEEMARLEQQRTHAFRRKHVLSTIAKAMENHEDEAKALVSGETAFATEMNLSANADILAAFRPVLEAIDEAVNKEGEIDEHAPLAALNTFETWYKDVKGAAVWALLDRENTELPRLDHY